MNDQLTIWGGTSATGIPTTHPSRPMTHRSDPPTSNGAAVIAIGHKVAVTRLVEDALRDAGPNGLNDFELAAKIRVKQTHCGKRRLDLVRDGRVGPLIDPDTGAQVRRPSDTGAPSAVWIYIAPETTTPVVEGRAAPGAPDAPGHPSPSPDAPNAG